MTTTLTVHARSERGIALIVVLLLMAILSGLATGFAMNGQVESTMAQNEVYYAGARAAAEAGMNRAIEAIRANTTTNLLRGLDDLVDAANPGAAVNADNGDVGFMLTGAAPYALDANGNYTYSIELFDDDDPALYSGTILSGTQLAGMNEDGSAYTDVNTRLILRATGWGPSNTMVRLARVLETNPNTVITPASTVNPAILVDGDLEINGNINLQGDYGSVHANGDLTISGNSAAVAGDATASGDFTANNSFQAGGTQGGNYASINLPAINASDYQNLADYTLHDNGTITDAAGNLCAVGCAGSNDWTFSLLTGTWTISGNSAPSGTFYVEGKVSISGSPKGPGNTALPLSIIATGTISVTGSPKLTPENDAKYQFITDGDLFLGGTGDLDDPTQVEGQILIKEQIHMQGNPEFQGRIIVQNDTSIFNDVTQNTIDGTPSITYNGTLPGYVIPPSSTTTYTNNFSGWIEQ